VRFVPTGDELRSLMRLFPAGVCVVGANADGDRLAVTVGSLVSLSLDPPLVGISIGRANALHELLRKAGAFGVSILRGDQAQVAAHFARGVPPIALWDGFETRTGGTGAPLLVDALGWIDCRIAGEHATGDHTFFIGEVESAEPGSGGRPLVFHGQSYLAL
jgi:flavin reductase (DIM6/NTAB) family NADH-FMN oxidoreductase RutF